MAMDINDQLRRFLYNLDLLLDDFRLEALNKTVDLYFDTADAKSAVLGLHDFYHPDNDSFDKRKFEQAERLVYCLATGNWLGPIHLLPPHQSEFLALLKLEFGVTLERDPVGAARRFLRNVGFSDMGHRITSVRTISEEEMGGIVKEQAGNAQQFFKAIQSMVPWQKRLPSMLNNGILHLTPQKVDYEMIIGHEKFSDLVNAFNEVRPSKPPQNLADALAIIVLSRQVGLYRTGAMRVPRIFASSHTFRRIIEKEEFASLLVYGKTPEGEPISAFRKEDYFVFRCTFRPDLQNGIDNNKVSSAHVQSQLETLRQEIAKFLKARTDLAATEDDYQMGQPNEKSLLEGLDKIKAFGQPLTKVIEQLKEFSFLENVWLQSSAPADLEKAVRQLVESAKEVRVKKSKKFKTVADRALVNVKDKLTENVRDVEWVMSLWDGLDQHIDNIFQRVPEKTPRPVNFFRDLGLLRYSFPRDTYEKIEMILKQLRGKEEGAKYAKRLVIVTCLTSIRGTRDPGNLIAAVAVLRAAAMDREIFELFSRIHQTLPHFSLKIVYVESMFVLLKTSPAFARTARMLKRIPELIFELERDRRRATKPQMRADLDVGLAYLYFRWWKHQGGVAAWRLPPQGKVNINKKLQSRIERAIDYAQRGYQYFRKQPDKLKEVYALNIYLYYLVEGGKNNREREIQEAATALLTYSDDPYVWQYRFDDTLARYYYRRAEARNDAENWWNAMEQAKKYIDSAVAEGIRDSDAEGCMKMIDNARDRGFVGRHWFFDS